LRLSVQHTVALLRQELEIRLHDLREKWNFKSLEQIFIEERIYRKIENAESWEAIVSTVDKGLKPFRAKFLRDVTEEDIKRLVEIPIRRISRFDSNRAEEERMALDDQIKETDKNLKQLTKYAIGYYENLLTKYGKGRERKTKIQRFSAIDASEVILSNLKVYFDREQGFIGTKISDGELLGNDFSSMDELLCFKEDGTFTITKVAEKTFVGQKILSAAKWNKDDTETVFNMVYRDGRGGPCMVKRFQIGGFTRDKQYDLTRGAAMSKTLYIQSQPQGVADKVMVHLVPQPRIKTEVPVNFNDFEVKGRNTAGVILTKHAVKKVERLTKLAKP
jgi:topoisomerase IV subunit A